MTYDPLFSQAVAVVLLHEGGFQCDREDPGNWTGGAVGQGELKGTNRGISAARYPDLDIAHLTDEQATAIYFRDFWQPYRWADLARPVALKAFDASVVDGPGPAIRALQRACWAAGKRVTEDGILGPETIDATGYVGLIKLIPALKSEVAAHFRLVAAARPAASKMLPGWLDRAYQ